MKELRDYLKTLKKYLWLVLALIILVNGGVLYYSQTQEKRFQASSTFFVTHQNEPRNSQYYTYEGFYAAQLSKEFTDVVVGLLNSPDITRLAIAKAQLTGDPKIATAVKKVSPQVVNVTVTAASQEAARKTILALAEVISTQSKSLTADPNQAVVVTSLNPDPTVAEAALNLPLYMAITTLGTVILSILFIIIREYLNA